MINMFKPFLVVMAGRPKTGKFTKDVAYVVIGNVNEGTKLIIVDDFKTLQMIGMHEVYFVGFLDDAEVKKDIQKNEIDFNFHDRLNKIEEVLKISEEGEVMLSKGVKGFITTTIEEKMKSYARRTKQ